MDDTNRAFEGAVDPEVAHNLAEELKDPERLLLAFKQGRLSRRHFVRLAAALGIGATATGPLSAAHALASERDSAPASKRQEIIIAASTTPPGLDYEFFFGKDVYDEIFNLNDRLTRWRWKPEGAGYSVAWQAQDYQGITKPRMAERWSVSPNGRVWTFHLRKGWKSHLGNELTAHDVKWMVARSFAVKGIGSFFDTIQNLAGPNSVKVADRYTVEFHLTGPTPDLLLEMSTFWRGIVDSTAARKHATHSDPWATAWLKTHDAGFGPYKLEKLVPGQEVVMVADDHHPFKARVKRLRFQIVPDASSRVALLARGDVDVAQDLSPQQLHFLAGSPGVKIWSFRGYDLLQSPLNRNYPPLDNPLVRQALSYAVPYDAIVNQVYKGFALRGAGPLAAADAGYDPSLFPYTLDLKKAQQLLKQSGHGSGFSTYYTYPTSQPDAEQMGIQLRTSFAKIGVHLALKGVPAAAFNQIAFSAKTPLGYYNFGADSPDPHYILAVFYLSTSSNNWGGYKNAAFDKALIQAGKILNWRQRVRAHQQVARILINDAGWLWIGQTGFHVATRNNLKNINWYPGEAVDWSVVDFK